MRFPQTLYVKVRKEGDTEWFDAQEDASDLVEMGERVRVGKYQIVEFLDARGIAQFDKPKRR